MMKTAHTRRKVGLKYCGGCQPRYDRTAAVARMGQRFKDRIVFVRWDDPEAEAVLVICGCDVACADVQAIDRPLFRVVSRAQADALTAEEML